MEADYFSLMRNWPTCEKTSLVPFLFLMGSPPCSTQVPTPAARVSISQFFYQFFTKHITGTEKQRSSLLRTKGCDNFQKEAIFLTFTNILYIVNQRELNDLYWVGLSRGCIIWLLAHPPPFPVSKLDRRYTGKLRKRDNLMTVEWGRG